MWFCFLCLGSRRFLCSFLLSIYQCKEVGSFLGGLVVAYLKWNWILNVQCSFGNVWSLMFKFLCKCMNYYIWSRSASRNDGTLPKMRRKRKVTSMKKIKRGGGNHQHILISYHFKTSHFNFDSRFMKPFFCQSNAFIMRSCFYHLVFDRTTMLHQQICHFVSLRCLVC